MKLLFAVLFSALAVSDFCTGVSAERLVWADEFDTLDPKTWFHYVTAGNPSTESFQYYRNNRKNSFVRDGKLFIRPTPTADEMPNVQRGRIAEADCNLEPCVSVGNKTDIVQPYYSAMLSSQFGFSPRYGRIEILAKMPTGDFLKPAITMLPTDEIYGEGTISGKINFASVYSFPELKDKNGVKHGINEVTSSVTVGEYSTYMGYENFARTISKSAQAPNGRNLGDGFHKYEFLWNEDQMKFSVDGQVINEINIPEGGFKALEPQISGSDYKAKNAPFDQPFYFVLSVGVGGGIPSEWLPEGRSIPWHGYSMNIMRDFWKARSTWEHTWGDADNHSLQIDYIRVYEN